MFKLLSASKNVGFERIGRVIKWILTRNGEKRLIGPLIRATRLIGGDITLSQVLAIRSFAVNCVSLYKTRGSKGVALYLKASSVLLMKYCGGDSISDTMLLGARVSRTRSGIPRWVVPAHRLEIRNGNVRIIRFWLTLFGLYRVLEFTKPFSVKTIVTPGPLYVDRFSEFIPVFFKGKSIEIKPWKPLVIRKSGPLSQFGSSKKGFEGLVKFREGPGWAPSWIQRSTTMSVLLLQAVQLWNGWPQIVEAMARVEKALGTRVHQSVVDLYVSYWGSLCSKGRIIFPPGTVGKLGVKEEPGKKRVFAMVDYWTQVVLKPLHSGLFDLLREIPQDGTFDQGAAVKSAIVEIGKRATPYVASFDLSAATDRLPVRLQAQLLDYLVPGLGEPWTELLVGRAYSIPRKYSSVATTATYAVGQPMGAYSSWAMLALTHHFLVQFAAMKTGIRGWFADYRILGDDIIIWDVGVALYYQQLMSQLGVEISLAKSLVSRNRSFEFAKRFILKGEDCSPIPLKEVSAATQSLEALLLLVTKLGNSVTPARFLAFLGFGYRVRGGLMKPLSKQSKVTALVIRFLSMPGKSEISFTRWAQWVLQTGINSHLELPLSFKSMIDFLQETVRKVPSRLDNLQRLDGGGYFQWERFLDPSRQDHPFRDVITDAEADEKFASTFREYINNQFEDLLIPLVKQWRTIQKDVKSRVPIFEEGDTPYHFDRAMEAYLDFIPDLSFVPRSVPQMCKRDTSDPNKLMVRRWMKVQKRLIQLVNRSDSL